MGKARSSRTAVLVCQARAVADGRLAVTRFGDPVARELLRGDELNDVEIARGLRPKRLSDRLTFDLLTATAAILVARTVAIDDALRARGTSQANKKARTQGLFTSSGRLELVSVEFGRDPLAEALESAWSPEEMRQLLTRHGFVVTSDRIPGAVAHELGVVEKPGRHVEHNRVVVADKA